MIYFLYGEDVYRAREKLREIVKSYKKVHKSGLNFKYIDFKDTLRNDSGDMDFFGNFRQTSMFAEKKMEVLVNPLVSNVFKNNFVKNAQYLFNTGDLILILEEGKIEKKDNVVKLLLKKAKCQEFEPLTPAKLKVWVKKEFEAIGKEIDALALDRLIFFVGNDLWRMSSEIIKLSNFKKSGIIKTEDINLLIKPKILTDIFKTIDAISLKDKRTALSLIHRHIENGDSPLYLLSMIIYQFKNLLAVKELMDKANTYELIVKKTGLHPYVVKKSYSQSQRFSFDELKNIYLKIFQADVDIKTGKIDPSFALDLIIAEI